MTRRLAVSLVAVVAAFLLLPVSGIAQTGPPTTGFSSPPDGATLAGPHVQVFLEASGVLLVPAGSQVKPGEGHLHVLVDIPAPAARGALSTSDPRVVHLGKPPFRSRSITLANGTHTLTAVLGDSEHLVIPDQKTASVRITVVDGFRGQGALTPACSSLATGTGDVRLFFPSEGGALQGTISSTCSFKTQDGSCSWTDTAWDRVDGTFDAGSERLSGSTNGVSQRRLRSGSRSTCGQDLQSKPPPSTLSGSVQGDTATGDVGGAHFNVNRNDAIDFVAAPQPLTASVAPAAAKKSGANVPIAIVAFLIAAILAAYGITALARRPAGH